MDLDEQKNFYDNRRYFQGKDNPGDEHPETGAAKRPSMGQLAFGVIFLAVVAALAWMRVRSENGPSPSSILGKPATSAPAAPAPAKK
jgi:hypothetical protein